MLTQIPNRLYQKNDHVKFEVEDGRKFELKYHFKDHKDRMRVLELRFKRKDMDQMSDQFRFPKKFMESGMLTSTQLKAFEKARDLAMREGMFMIVANKLKPDYARLVQYYADEFCKPVADAIIDLLKENGEDTRRDRIEMAMKVVQDIPYGVPQHPDDGYIYSGLITPPQIFFLQYGDCDSKSILFAGILSYLIPKEEIAFLGGKGHVLVGIQDEVEGGMAIVRHDGKIYVMAETAGPGRNHYGQHGRYGKGSPGFKVYPLV